MCLRARKDGNDYVLTAKRSTSARPNTPEFSSSGRSPIPSHAGRHIGVSRPGWDAWPDRRQAERSFIAHGLATNVVTFENCRVPVSAIMRGSETAFRSAVGELSAGGIGIAALSLGIARAAMDKAKAYVKGTQAVLGPASGRFEFQALQDDRRPAKPTSKPRACADPEIAAATEGSRRPLILEASMAKLFVSGGRPPRDGWAVQIFGGRLAMPTPASSATKRCANYPHPEGHRDQRLVIARETLEIAPGRPSRRVAIETPCTPALQHDRNRSGAGPRRVRNRKSVGVMGARPHPDPPSRSRWSARAQGGSMAFALIRTFVGAGFHTEMRWSIRVIPRSTDELALPASRPEPRPTSSSSPRRSNTRSADRGSERRRAGVIVMTRDPAGAGGP